MIDSIIASYSRLQYPDNGLPYRPDQAVLSRTYVPSDADELTIFFPPWHGNSVAQLFRRRAERHGKAMLLYGLHDKILTDDTVVTHQSFLHVQREASEEIGRLCTEGQYRKLHLIGYSLGNVSLAMTTSKIDADFRATLVVGSSDLAHAVWQGIRTKHIRSRLEEQGITESDLVSTWADLAPTSYAECFEGRQVNMIVSRTDRVIPATQQMQLVESLSRAGADLSVRMTNLGHYTSIARHAIGKEVC